MAQMRQRKRGKHRRHATRQWHRGYAPTWRKQLAQWCQRRRQTGDRAD